MAIRTFRDASGADWEVWDTTPEGLHPKTRAEDYMQALGSGWLTFERGDGGEKRRLPTIPGGWEELSEERLDALRRKAELVRSDVAQWRGPRSTPSAPAGTPTTTAPRADRIGVSPGGTQRSFTYPGGRLWSVYETRGWATDAEGTGARTILRFASGTRHLDLVTWPGEWASFTDAGLVALIRRAFPRDAASQKPSSYTRRHGDAR
ncbi:MAG: hypothetical protein NVS4B3_21070 [Gemmatimonadaceae bacterium]